jgi:hypothetical protein
VKARPIDPNDPRLQEPTPEPEPGAADPADDRQTEWYRFLEAIDNFLAEQPDDFYARSTLEGISNTVEAHRRVTVGQRVAFENIERSTREQAERRGSRRSEGFYGRFR